MQGSASLSNQTVLGPGSPASYGTPCRGVRLSPSFPCSSRGRRPSPGCPSCLTQPASNVAVGVRLTEECIPTAPSTGGGLGGSAPRLAVARTIEGHRRQSRRVQPPARSMRRQVAACHSPGGTRGQARGLPPATPKATATRRFPMPDGATRRQSRAVTTSPTRCAPSRSGPPPAHAPRHPSGPPASRSPSHRPSSGPPAQAMTAATDPRHRPGCAP